MIAGLGEILNRKLNRGEKLDKIQPPQRPWSLEVTTHTHAHVRKISNTPKSATKSALKSQTFIHRHTYAQE